MNALVIPLKSNSKILFCIVALALFVLFDSCKKDNPAPIATIETDSITDIDGNVYKTVKIGNQWWMAENLRVTKYRNGYAIPETKDSADWVTKTSGGYCRYENNPSTDEALGLLYNQYVITDTGNIAPHGWHIPSDNEWKQLEMHLGMSQTDCDKTGWRGRNEADMLKISSPEGWTSYGSVWSTNESGFTALAGSCRLNNAAFGQPGLFSTGFWWTSTTKNEEEAYYRYLDYKNSNIFRSHESYRYGMSIRCVKD